jgi:hypothetical protein
MGNSELPKHSISPTNNQSVSATAITNLGFEVVERLVDLCANGVCRWERGSFVPLYSQAGR